MHLQLQITHNQKKRKKIMNNNNEVREIHASQSSCEINVNAKGQWSAKIKVYADDIDDAFQRANTYATVAETKIKEKNS